MHRLNTIVIYDRSTPQAWGLKTKPSIKPPTRAIHPTGVGSETGHHVAGTPDTITSTPQAWGLKRTNSERWWQMIMTVTQGDATAEWNDVAGKFVGNKELASLLNLLHKVFARIGNDSFQNIIDDAELNQYVVTAYEPNPTQEGLLDGI
jgi:hypothetical protein